MKQELNQLKGEVIKEIATTRPKNRLANCSLLLFLVILCLVGFGVWSAAATGLLDVPLASRFAYHKPQPDRLVKPGVPLETLLEEQVKTTLTKRVYEGKWTLEDRTISVTIPETSLTSSLRTLIETGRSGLVDSRGAQVMVNEDGTFVFFLPVADSAKNTAVQLRMSIVLEKEGMIRLIPYQFTVGSFVIPKALTTFFLQPFIQSQLPQLNQALQTLITLTAVTYQQGAVTLNGLINVEVQ